MKQIWVVFNPTMHAHLNFLFTKFLMGHQKVGLIISVNSTQPKKLWVGSTGK